MPQCFVIQPFDKGGKFDKRYAETFAPAIKKAGFTAYRVDFDPAVSIPIESIEEQILASDACLADVTAPNPNVWYELGFALAARKDVVIICEDGSYAHYPFDIQHRRVIAYKNESAGDFQKLADRIGDRLQAIMVQQEKRTTLSTLTPLKPTDGLTAHEVSALALVMQESIAADDSLSMWVLRREMERSGYTKVATSIAVHRLSGRSFIKQVKLEDPQNGELYTAFVTTPDGVAWMLANEDKPEGSPGMIIAYI